MEEEAEAVDRAQDGGGGDEHICAQRPLRHPDIARAFPDNEHHVERQQLNHGEFYLDDIPQEENKRDDGHTVHYHDGVAAVVGALVRLHYPGHKPGEEVNGYVVGQKEGEKLNDDGLKRPEEVFSVGHADKCGKGAEQNRREKTAQIKMAYVYVAPASVGTEIVAFEVFPAALGGEYQLDYIAEKSEHRSESSVNKDLQSYKLFD